MSSDLALEIRLGLTALDTIRQQIAVLVSQTTSSEASDIETAAACAMLHWFYTEMEKILTLIAQDWDGRLPSSESWHKELLNQMAGSTDSRPAILAADLVGTMSEFLAFRHLFRGASIGLLRWNKLEPLLAKVEPTHTQFIASIEAFRDSNLG